MEAARIRKLGRVADSFRDLLKVLKPCREYIIEEMKRSNKGYPVWWDYLSQYELETLPQVFKDLLFGILSVAAHFFDNVFVLLADLG